MVIGIILNPALFTKYLDRISNTVNILLLCRFVGVTSYEAVVYSIGKQHANNIHGH